MKHINIHIILHHPNVNVHRVILHVQLVVGVVALIIVKNLVKLIVHHNVHKDGALDQNHVNVVIYFVPVVVLAQHKKIV